MATQLGASPSGLCPAHLPASVRVGGLDRRFCSRSGTGDGGGVPCCDAATGECLPMRKPRGATAAAAAAMAGGGRGSSGGGAGGFLPPSGWPYQQRTPTMSSLSRRIQPSSSRSMSTPTWAIEYEFSRETGLPLILCPTCGRERVIELIVKSSDNGNQGRVFFKCPTNEPGVPGRCRFYEFQKTYLKKLVELKYVVIDLEVGLAAAQGEEPGAWGFGQGEEVQSQLAGSAPWLGGNAPRPNTIHIEMKLDALFSLLKMFSVALFFCFLVGTMYAVFN